MIDYSVYPDVDELPIALNTSEDRADYVARICGAWDFGVVPTPETFSLFAAWGEVFDCFPLLHSPAYAAFRSWFGWPPILGGSVLQANFEQVDRRNGRSTDFCLEWIAIPLLDFTMQQIEPQRPADLDPIATSILEQLSRYPEAQHVVLGGHFALKCYFSYRQTHDIDAWWASQTAEREQQLTLDRLRSIVQQVGAENGLTLDERTTRSMTSLELKQGRDTQFSVQIGERDVELDPPIPSPWSPVLIETLRDNIGAKMNALVNRGAPRDFVDIRAVVTAGIASIDEVWDLWQQKSLGLDSVAARQQVLNHLESIELRRPLNQVAVERREATASSRQWFREEFLGCPPT